LILERLSREISIQPSFKYSELEHVTNYSKPDSHPTTRYTELHTSALLEWTLTLGAGDVYGTAPQACHSARITNDVAV
jgi:hypothetical protein